MIEGKIYRECGKDSFMFDSPDKETTEKIVKALRDIVKFRRPSPNF